MRRVAVRSGFVHQTFALQNAKAVLLINSHKAEPRELNIFFNQRMRADYQLRFARKNPSHGSLFVRTLQSADEQFHAIARLAENAPRGKEVLDRKNFRRRHERSEERRVGKECTTR